MKKIFITGTDTGIGKTHVTLGLLKSFKKKGLKTIALKPIASGCERKNGRLENEDACLLQENATEELSYEQVNPFAFEPPIAPHLADHQKMLSVKNIMGAVSPLFHLSADICCIEGCGGWMLPLNATETMADFVLASQCEVILVVGIRLGCLNHALLTVEQIQRTAINFVGWIANSIDPHMLCIQENIETLKQRLKVPLLKIVPFGGYAHTS